jgi:chaperone BCS1
MATAGPSGASSSAVPLAPASPPALSPEALPGAADAGPTFLGLSLSSNPYFSAGFGLMLFGSALAVGRRGASSVAGLAQRRLLVSLEIASKDRAHPWLLAWLGAQAQAQASNPALRKEGLRALAGLSGEQEAMVQPTRIWSHELAVETSFKPKSEQAAQGGDQRGEARFSLVPGPGTHWFRYKGNWMRVSVQMRHLPSLQCSHSDPSCNASATPRSSTSRRALPGRRSRSRHCVPRALSSRNC